MARHSTHPSPTFAAPAPAPAGEAAPAEEATPAGQATVDIAAPTGGVSMLHLSKLDIVLLGAIQGAVPKVAFSHMARPSRKPIVKDVDACPAKDAAGGAAEAATGGGQKSCYSFSKGDVVEVSWGKRHKRTKHAATVLAIDHSKRAQPVHAQFGADGNAWVSAGSVVKHTNGAVACGGTPEGLDGLGARLSAAGGLAARANLVYKSSQHCRSNEAVGEAVAPAIGAIGLLTGGVGGVKGATQPVGCEARLQGCVKSVFAGCCGICGKVGGR